MYDGLYETFPEFEKQTGWRVEIAARLTHPDLNARIKREFGSGEPDIDFLSTHTKHVPFQAPWLAPLEEIVPAGVKGDLLRGPREMSLVDGRLLQVPRILDMKLLYY